MTAPPAALTITLDLPDLMAYGAATWDWHRSHYDRDWARASGLPDCMVDGQFFGALFARQIGDSYGPAARIVAMRLRYHALAFATDTITVTATLDTDADGPPGQVALLQEAHRDEIRLASARTEILLPTPSSESEATP